MKYILILGDGMSDEPIDCLRGKTPLEIANKPCMDNLAKKGIIGKVQTIPNGFSPGSDVANLSVLGFSPQKYYTGRSPLEAASMWINLQDSDVTFRANLVTLSDDKEFENKIILDYSAGEIPTKEANILIEYLSKNLNLNGAELFCGKSYRHCLLVKNFLTANRIFTPPHDITGKKITEFLPKGENNGFFLHIMKESEKLLHNHPVNQKRKSEGKNIANSLWFWGEGKKPQIPSFQEKYNLSGAMISAVDLLKGIAKLADMQSIDVEGATGTINTNFEGKCQAAIDAFSCNDFVFVHIEAPDECGHQGDIEGKIKSIELIDEKIVKPIYEHLMKSGQFFSMLIMPDHSTPLKKKTHTKDAVPFIFYRSADEKENNLTYCEKDAAASGIFFESGEELINEFFSSKK